MQNSPAHLTVIEHPLVQVKLTQLRDVATAPNDFRARVSELAILMVCEATRDLATRAQSVRTPNIKGAPS